VAQIADQDKTKLDATGTIGVKISSLWGGGGDFKLPALKLTGWPSHRPSNHAGTLGRQPHPEGDSTSPLSEAQINLYVLLATVMVPILGLLRPTKDHEGH
jgi:hypothetical protein